MSVFSAPLGRIESVTQLFGYVKLWCFRNQVLVAAA